MYSDSIVSTAAILILSIAAVLIGAFCSWPHKDYKIPAKYYWWTLLSWLLPGAICAWIVTEGGVGELFRDYRAEANWIDFYKRNQISLLALSVALAAYVSNIEQKLREAIGKENLIEKKAVHYRNLIWLLRADVILVLTAAFLIVRASSWAYGFVYGVIDRAIFGLLLWNIFYFAIIHAYQLFRHFDPPQAPSDAVLVTQLIKTLTGAGKTKAERDVIFDSAKQVP